MLRLSTQSCTFGDHNLVAPIDFCDGAFAPHRLLVKHLPPASIRYISKGLSSNGVQKDEVIAHFFL